MLRTAGASPARRSRAEWRTNAIPPPRSSGSKSTSASAIYGTDAIAGVINSSCAGFHRPWRVRHYGDSERAEGRSFERLFGFGDLDKNGFSWLVSAKISKSGTSGLSRASYLPNATGATTIAPGQQHSWQRAPAGGPGRTGDAQPRVSVPAALFVPDARRTPPASAASTRA